MGRRKRRRQSVQWPNACNQWAMAEQIIWVQCDHCHEWFHCICVVEYTDRQVCVVLANRLHCIGDLHWSMCIVMLSNILSPALCKNLLRELVIMVQCSTFVIVRFQVPAMQSVERTFRKWAGKVIWRAVCVKTTFSRRRPLFLENLLSASTFQIRVDVYERQLAFSSRRLKSASTFMMRFHVDV